MKSATPCKGCENRCQGCHSNCEDYIEWKHIMDAKRLQKQKIAKLNADYMAVRKTGRKHAK